MTVIHSVKVNPGLYNRGLQRDWDFLGSQKGFDRRTTQLTAIFTQPIDWKCADSRQTSSLSLSQWYPCQLGTHLRSVMFTQLTWWIKCQSLWIWVCKSPPPSTSRYVYILACVSTGPARRQWLRPVPLEAPCVQSRTRSTETAGWWVGTMLPSLTHRKEKEGKKQTKMFAFNWGIMRDCLTYLSP